MADQDWPNQSANKAKAEGDRWSAEQESSQNADRDEHPEKSYPSGSGGKTGGISNRPTPEEVEKQENLPERGTQKDRTANPGSTRREGDYAEDEE